MVHRFFDERWNKQNYAVVDELLTADQVEEHKAWMGRGTPPSARCGSLLMTWSPRVIWWRSTGQLTGSWPKP
jgi:hypothetical protein